jgi:uncharacterized protein YggE
MDVQASRLGLEGGATMSEISSKRTYYLAAIAMVAIVMISALAITRPPTMQLPTAQGQGVSNKTLQVSGEGTVSAAPDEALVSLGVQTQAVSATQAASDNAQTMSNVLQALSSIGIDKGSIQTVSYSLSPVYESNPSTSAPAKIVGYTAVNTIQVTLTDLSFVGKSIDTAVNAGANEVQDITFTFSTTTYASLQKQALAAAIQDAGGQAQAIASSLGVTLGGPISVTPAYIFQPNVQRFAAASVPTAVTPVQPGNLQVSVTVQVTYAFS